MLRQAQGQVESRRITGDAVPRRSGESRFLAPARIRRGCEKLRKHPTGLAARAVISAAATHFTGDLPFVGHGGYGPRLAIGILPEDPARATSNGRTLKCNRLSCRSAWFTGICRRSSLTLPVLQRKTGSSPALPFATLEIFAVVLFQPMSGGPGQRLCIETTARLW